MKKPLRAALVVLGLVSLGLGIVGIFLPVVPTTPFLLLAAACFVRSSDRLYRRLLSHRILGPYIRDYREGRGIPRRAKLLALAMIWGSILLSGGLLFLRLGLGRTWIALALFLAASAAWGTYFVGFRTPTRVESSSCAQRALAEE